MYAVIETGGKQYKVAADDMLEIEKLVADEADQVTFERVLMVHDGSSLTVGKPVVEGATVTAEVVQHRRTDKKIIFKKRQRQTYRRFGTHRQTLTLVRITGINAAAA